MPDNHAAPATWLQSPQVSQQPRILRIMAACAYLGVSRTVILKAIKNNELRQVRLTSRTMGFTIEDLDAFIEMKTEGAQPKRAALLAPKPRIVASDR